ncbi:MAG: ABC transporter permease [Candidatus Hodarchaeota archaeon]
MWILSRRNWAFNIAIVGVLAIIAFGFVAPMFTRDPFDFFQKDKNGKILIFSSPSLDYPLGTDDYARDVFAQLAHATRNSLFIGFLTGIIVVIIGIGIGSMAGFLGGWYDDLLMLFTNIFMVFPVFPVLIILAAYVEERSIYLVIMIIAIVSWPWVARATRSQVLSLRERDFINLARVSGMKNLKIAAVEVLPNMLAYIGLIMAVVTAGAMIAETGISLMGFGPDPLKYITLGEMLNRAYWNESLRSGFWWTYFPPGVILTSFFVFLFIIHRNLDELFNPRLKRR